MNGFTKEILSEDKKKGKERSAISKVVIFLKEILFKIENQVKVR